MRDFILFLLYFSIFLAKLSHLISSNPARLPENPNPSIARSSQVPSCPTLHLTPWALKPFVASLVYSSSPGPSSQGSTVVYLTLQRIISIVWNSGRFKTLSQSSLTLNLLSGRVYVLSTRIQAVLWWTVSTNPMWWEWYCVICETVPWKALQLITCFLNSLPRVPVPGLTTLSLPWCESLRPMETPRIGAKPSNESKWALSWFQLCRVAPSLQIFPAGVQTWRSRVKLFILCPVWILDRTIFEFNEMAVLKCPAKFEGDLLHSNSSYNRKLELNLSQISDKELKSGFFVCFLWLRSQTQAFSSGWYAFPKWFIKPRSLNEKLCFLLHRCPRTP